MATNVNLYAAWQPVRINAGGGSTTSDYGIETGFFINETGLQWSSVPSDVSSAEDVFGGWLGKSRAIPPVHLLGTKCLSGADFSADVYPDSLQLVA
jgi:hypothetical protein